MKIIFSVDFIRKAKQYIGDRYLEEIGANDSYVVAMRLRSAHSVRLYQLVGMLGEGSRTFEIEELKEILGVQGKYEGRPVDFIKRIVKHSQDELNREADWTFSFSTVKDGKKTTGIILTRIPGQMTGPIPARNKTVKVSPPVTPEPIQPQIKPVERPRQEPADKTTQKEEKSPEGAGKRPQIGKVKAVGFWDSLWGWFRSFWRG